MSDAAPAAAAAGSSPVTSAPSQAHPTAAASERGGSSNNKPESKAGPGTERAPSERSVSASKDADRDSGDKEKAGAEKRDAKAPIVEKRETASTGEKHKVRVDGKELEVDIDELKRGYSHAAAAAERMKKSAEAQKSAEPMIRAVQSLKDGDPGPLVDLVGIDAMEEIAEAVLQSRVEWDELTPEQKRLAQLEMENKGFKSEKQKEADKLAAARKAELETQAYEEIDTEIGQILSKAGKKATPRMIARTVEYMCAQLDLSKGAKKLSAEEAYARVKGDMRLEIPEYLDGLSAEEALEHLPESVSAALRAHWIEEAKAQDPFRSGRRDSSSNDDPNPTSKSERLSTDDWFANKERKFGGR